MQVACDSLFSLSTGWPDIKYDQNFILFYQIRHQMQRCHISAAIFFLVKPELVYVARSSRPGSRSSRAGRSVSSSLYSPVSVGWRFLVRQPAGGLPVASPGGRGGFTSHSIHGGMNRACPVSTYRPSSSLLTWELDTLRTEHCDGRYKGLSRLS